MSLKPLSVPLPLLLPLPRSFAASLASSLAFFAARLSLQSDLCPRQALVWHAVQQYATSPQPPHVLNACPFFFGLILHSPHSVKSGISCCLDDMAWLGFALLLLMLSLSLSPSLLLQVQISHLFLFICPYFTVNPHERSRAERGKGKGKWVVSNQWITTHV
jgi:hypothetical protein